MAGGANSGNGGHGRPGGYFRVWRDYFESAVATTAPHAWERVLLRLMAQANWKRSRLHNGTTIEPGQVVLSRRAFARKCGVSEQQMRGALSGLAQAGFLTHRATQRYTLVTLTNWEVEQGRLNSEEPTSQPTEQPTNNPLATHSQPTNNPILEGKKGRRVEERDLDCRNRKADSDLAASSSKCKDYPAVKRALTEYGGSEPPTRIVVDVMDASGRSSESEVVDCLEHLYAERGLHPGTDNGPRSWKWFPTVVQEHFEKVEARREAANPTGYDDWESRNEKRGAA